MKAPEPKTISSSLWEEAKEIESLIKLSSFLDKLPPNKMRDELLEKVNEYINPAALSQEIILQPDLALSDEPEKEHEIKRLKDVINAADNRIFHLESVNSELDRNLRVIAGTWWYKLFSTYNIDLSV